MIQPRLVQSAQHCCALPFFRRVVERLPSKGFPPGKGSELKQQTRPAHGKRGRHLKLSLQVAMRGIEWPAVFDGRELGCQTSPSRTAARLYSIRSVNPDPYFQHLQSRSYHHSKALDLSLGHRLRPHLLESSNRGIRILDHVDPVGPTFACHGRVRPPRPPSGHVSRVGHPQRKVGGTLFKERGDAFLGVGGTGNVESDAGVKEVLPFRGVVRVPGEGNKDWSEGKI